MFFFFFFFEIRWNHSADCVWMERMGKSERRNAIQIHDAVSEWKKEKEKGNNKLISSLISLFSYLLFFLFCLLLASCFLFFLLLLCLRWSPCDTIKSDSIYPSILATSGMNDSRVQVRIYTKKKKEWRKSEENLFFRFSIGNHLSGSRNFATK